MFVLKVNRSQIWMVFVAMPTAVEPRVRIGVVDPVVLFTAVESPFNVQ